MEFKLFFFFKRKLKKNFFGLLAPSLVLFSHSLFPYNVVFEGVQDNALLKTLKTHSELLALKDHPPASLQSLEYRANSDIPGLIKTLHAFGYYDAIIKTRVEEVYKDTPIVILNVELGVQYRIGSFDIHTTPTATPVELEKPLDIESAGIHIGDPALSSSVLQAQDNLLTSLANSGYPLARITERKAIVDGKAKTLQISLLIDRGPLCHFGKVEISGNPHIKSLVILNKIKWKEGEVFSKEKIDATQKNLLDTNLFSSVEIDTDTTANAEGKLPIRIQVTESKYKSISVGASYQTHWGAGGNIAWENRNVGGIGSRLHFEADVTQRSHTGIISYVTPDFRKVGQDLVWQIEASRAEVAPSYSSRSYSLLGRIEKKVSDHFSISYGLGGEKLFVTHSVQNSHNWLANIPLYLRYNTTNSLLNPSSGFKTHYHLNPSLNFSESSRPYIYQEARLSTYQPILKDYIVLAHLFTFGSILSYDLSDVPVSKRIFGGNEENLRGYKFQTVSPLNSHHKPIGGRGGVFYSFEVRFRLNKSIGIVPFFDTGRVSRLPFPNVVGKWYKSAGVGFRYYTFFGPFRVDLGFPLDRREGIDNRFRFLASIGQTF